MLVWKNKLSPTLQDYRNGAKLNAVDVSNFSFRFHSIKDLASKSGVEVYGVLEALRRANAKVKEKMGGQNKELKPLTEEQIFEKIVTSSTGYMFLSLPSANLKGGMTLEMFVRDFIKVDQSGKVKKSDVREKFRFLSPAEFMYQFGDGDRIEGLFGAAFIKAVKEALSVDLSKSKQEYEGISMKK